MSSEQVLLVAAGVVALVALLLAVRAHARAARAGEVANALAERLALLESPLTDATLADATLAGTPRPVADAPATGTYVITSIDESAAPAPAAQHIDGRLFADIVARETVVKAASWAHGLRRALSPESRNRIRFHVRQETRQAGRERRAEMRQALREFRARERAVASDVGEDVA